jgi:hypothetical protein
MNGDGSHCGTGCIKCRKMQEATNRLKGHVRNTKNDASNFVLKKYLTAHVVNDIKHCCGLRYLHLYCCGHVVFKHEKYT